MSTKKVSPQNIKYKNLSNQEKFLLNIKRAEEFLSDSSHHAYCLITQNPSEGGAVLKEAVKSVWDISHQGNSDFLHYQKGSIGIDDAHFIRDWGSVNSAEKSEKVCLLETYAMTSESQNALLNLFESAPRYTRFLIVINSKEILLPTLSSRLAIFILSTNTDSAINIDDFLKANVGDRDEMLKEIVKNRDKAEAQKFLDALEERLYELESLNSDPLKFSSFTKSIPFIKKTNIDQRSSLKNLLDHVIYFAPTVKKENQNKTK